MSKQQRQVKQTNIRGNDANEHHIEHTEIFDDSLLPEASEITQLHQIDPNIIEWLKTRAEKEQEHRHSFDRERLQIVKSNEKSNRLLNAIGLVCAFFIFMGGMGLSYFLINTGHTVAGTLFSGFTLLSGAGLFISRNIRSQKDEEKAES